MNRIRTAMFLAAFIVVLPWKDSSAQIGVIDPVEIAKTVLLGKQIGAQYAFWQQQISQMEGMVQNYRSVFASLQNLNPRDVYGNITALGNAANTGAGASGGYSAATVPLVFQNINGLPMEAIRRLKTRYGDAQLSDESNKNDWTLIGNVRANAQQNTTALASLSNDSLASDATTLQVAQKANAAQALTVQQLNTIQQVSAAQLEQQVEAAQRERNRAAVQMANEIAFSQSAQAIKDSTRGLGDSLKGINPGE